MSMLKLRRLWNFWILSVTTIVLACFSEAVAQASYKVTDLGTLNNGNLGCAMNLNNHGWTEVMYGTLDPFSDSTAGKLVQGRAVIDVDGLKIDLGTLGGPNSWMNWGGISDRGQVVGMSETSVPDPDGEDVCGFGTKLTCRPFLWHNGHMSALPTLGGNNGQASDINNHRQIAGTAETTATDFGCPPSHISLPVLWEEGKAKPLPTVGSDPDGFAFAINHQGQAVGYSGTCTAALHAVLWENDTASLLPDFRTGANALAINDQGQVAGTVGSPDGTTQYAALWQSDALTNLGLLPGDFGSFASGINNRSQVVGSAFDSNFNWSHGFIWQNGVMTDLNTLFPASSNLYVLMANKINDRGQISGMALVLSGPHAGKEFHAFLATPVNASIGTSVADVAPRHPNSNLPANVRKQLLQRFRLGRFGR
jgi:probable HAF family extracellular repeat protein